MILIEKTDAYGWEAAIRGMRNPMNSWNLSDSKECGDKRCVDCNYRKYCDEGYRAFPEMIVPGPADLELMKKLAAAGCDHGKFLRMIIVTADLTAPLYWWKEFDTYRVGVTPNPIDIEMNSCSTMHKIHAKEFTLDDFSHEHLTPGSVMALRSVIERLNIARNEFLKGREASDFGRPSAKDYWWDMIQLLPTSYNQKRTVQMNYAVLKNIYHARKSHKLDEWRDLCRWIERQPYSELITG